MPLRLALTDYQLSVVRRRLADTDTSPSQLAVAAVQHEQARAPEPRWRGRRPPGRRPSRIRAGVRLDAVLPAASGGALALARGQRLRVEQIIGGQCVDLCAFEAGGPGRAFSAARTRAMHGIHPGVGSLLWSTAPEVPLLVITADSAPGHDLCFPPCSEFEYERHAGIAGHLGCAEILATTEARLGRQPNAGSGVLNLWLPSAVDADGRLRSWPAACRRGDFVQLTACRDVVVTVSTCPDDLFGSSQYAPAPVRVIVTGDGPRSSPTAGSPWPVQPPGSALACHELAVELPGPTLAAVRTIAAGGWLGDRPDAVIRALIFRHHEAMVDGGAAYAAGQSAARAAESSRARSHIESSDQLNS